MSSIWQHYTPKSVGGGGSLRRSPRHPNRGQLRAFGARSASHSGTCDAACKLISFSWTPELKTQRRPCLAGEPHPFPSIRLLCHFLKKAVTRKTCRKRSTELDK